MKKLLAVVAVLAVFAGVVYAGTVNPTSNVLGDTDATANTLVYRDANGVFDAASLEDGTVVTAKIATNAVTTQKLLLLTSAGVSTRILCVTTAKTIGICANAGANGSCNCSD